MPGLLRGVARTAAVAGTATAVSNRVSRRQARKWGGGGDTNYVPMRTVPEQQPPPQQYAPSPPPYAPPPVAPEDERIARLKQLGELKQQGVLSEQEFAAEKARILG